MAARRLIVVMLVLLIVSSAAAALVPEIERNADTSTTTTSTEQAPEAESEGRVVARTVDTAPERPAEIALQPGDRLSLSVRGDQVALVSIPSLGLSEDVAPLSPARFDLLFDEPGVHVVRADGSADAVARITVEAPVAKPAAGRSPGGDGAG